MKEIRRNPDCQSCENCRIKFRVKNGRLMIGKGEKMEISCRKGMWSKSDRTERKFKTLDPLGTGSNLPEWCDNYERMDD